VEAFAGPPEDKVAAHDSAGKKLMELNLAGPGNGKPLPLEEWVAKL